ncbi:hypothetical protein COCCADRAFT_100567 [Bipolaris zeicola 26-R-13]|uniref:Uncharacterized protein n=1 Tax=Cochliobolus carbonum (strain 26-R-13) TaxID=930089 RepID=W6YKA5_COCC2|nr:uncharacterized protein COCCADRAFT_100567 [Bipolaris zeicola 26-R-13]EUC31701.1 hypothetical protein COCCADRAFT_100567 [Bipolaris zeicola 26-R-13]
MFAACKRPVWLSLLCLRRRRRRRRLLCLQVEPEWVPNSGTLDARALPTILPLFAHGARRSAFLCTRPSSIDSHPVYDALLLYPTRPLLLTAHHLHLRFSARLFCLLRHLFLPVESRQAFSTHAFLAHRPYPGRLPPSQSGPGAIRLPLESPSPFSPASRHDTSCGSQLSFLLAAFARPASTRQ